MPTEQLALTEHERALIERVAEQLGVTFEQAIEQMAKEGLAARVRRKTGRGPAKVYSISDRRRRI